MNYRIAHVDYGYNPSVHLIIEDKDIAVSWRFYRDSQTLDVEIANMQTDDVFAYSYPIEDFQQLHSRTTSFFTQVNRVVSLWED